MQNASPLESRQENFNGCGTLREDFPQLPESLRQQNITPRWVEDPFRPGYFVPSTESYCYQNLLDNLTPYDGSIGPGGGFNNAEDLSCMVETEARRRWVSGNRVAAGPNTKSSSTMISGSAPNVMGPGAGSSMGSNRLVGSESADAANRIDLVYPNTAERPDEFRCNWKGCQYSGTFSREAGVVEHIKEAHIAEHPDEFRCNWEGCQYSGTFGRKAELVRHIKGAHIARGSHRCRVPGCGKVCNRGDNLQEHMRRRHPKA